MYHLLKPTHTVLLHDLEQVQNLYWYSTISSSRIFCRSVLEVQIHSEHDLELWTLAKFKYQNVLKSSNFKIKQIFPPRFLPNFTNNRSVKEQQKIQIKKFTFLIDDIRWKCVWNLLLIFTNLQLVYALTACGNRLGIENSCRECIENQQWFDRFRTIAYGLKFRLWTQWNRSRSIVLPFLFTLEFIFYTPELFWLKYMKNFGYIWL